MFVCWGFFWVYVVFGGGRGGDFIVDPVEKVIAAFEDSSFFSEGGLIASSAASEDE